MFWIIKQYLAPGIQSKLRLYPYFVFIFFIGATDSFVKCLHIFINSLLVYLTKLFAKTLASAVTFKYTVI